MKQLSLSLLLTLACASSISAMETDDNNNTITFLSPEQILEQPEVMLPNEYEATKQWIGARKEALGLPSKHQPCNTHLEWEVSSQGIQSVMESSQSLSQQNYIVDTGVNTIVRVAGLSNTLRSRTSAAGIDPGRLLLDSERLAIINGQRKMAYKLEFLQQATANTQPVFQHTSMVAYYLIMEKRLKGKKVQPVQTWLAKRDTSEQDLASQELNDHNYVIVQPKNPKRYKRLDTLDPTEFNNVVTKELLPDLADAVDSGGWNLNRENLFYDTDIGNYYITDLEKPNNEGWGPTPGTNPRWGTAVLSLKGDGTSSHPWKWDHNIRCGYDAIKTGLLAHSVNKQNLVQEWDALKAAHAPKE